MHAVLQKAGAFLLLCFTSCWLFAAELAAIPALTAPVMDTAGMMSQEGREALNRHLLQYSREKGSQIVVLTVPTVAPETPFDYSARVMDSWKIGRKDFSDGVLLLLVRDERKTHLAVGRGLEGAIPDVYAKRILEDVLRPHLQQGQTDQGIAGAVGQIEKLIAGEALPEAQTGGQETAGMDWALLLFLPFFLSGIMKAVLGRTLGSLAVGGITFLAVSLMGGGLVMAVLAGLGGTLLAFVFGSGAFVSSGAGRGRGSRGGWHGGGFGGGNGGFGGGGFSGGGGGFGGGGASGGW